MTATETRERPILFNDEMVRAILEGRKTQTRRPVRVRDVAKPIRGLGGSRTEMRDHMNAAANLTGVDWTARELLALCPFGSPGDRLWVREAFAVVPESAYRCSTGIEQTINPADPYSAAVYRVGFDRSRSFPWKPSIHMPRWASRITLEVNAVRVEKVQEITLGDLDAEGIRRLPKKTALDSPPFVGANDAAFENSLDAWISHWDSISAKGLGWDANLWVWVVEFERVKS